MWFHTDKKRTQMKKIKVSSLSINQNKDDISYLLSKTVSGIQLVPTLIISSKLPADVNLIRRKNEKKNTILDVNGAEAVYAGCSLSIYMISLIPGETLLFSKTTGSPDNTVRYAYYTKGMTFISRSFFLDNAASITVPTNAFFLKISYPDNAIVKLSRGINSGYSIAPEDMAAGMT